MCGARRVVMVESDPKVAAALRESARSLAAEGVDVVTAEALGWLERTDERFDVVFVDPPYASALAPAALRALPARLNPGARVYVESAEPLAPQPPWRALRVLLARSAGSGPTG